PSAPTLRKSRRVLPSQLVCWRELNTLNMNTDSLKNGRAPVLRSARYWWDSACSRGRLPPKRVNYSHPSLSAICQRVNSKDGSDSGQCERLASWWNLCTQVNRITFR